MSEVTYLKAYAHLDSPLKYGRSSEFCTYFRFVEKILQSFCTSDIEKYIVSL